MHSTTGKDHMRDYQLHAYVVMANHVHILITPSTEVAKITIRSSALLRVRRIEF